MSTDERTSQLSASTDCPPPASASTIQRITSRAAEVGGGISVSRLLPSPQRRMIGAWCFLDHAGPAQFAAGTGLRVGPHPHIGLQTFTWMLAGEVLHRDSLGNVQLISPGQVNLMTAGHGISHTEESLATEEQLHAAQLWIALPSAERNRAPAFDHYPQLPQWQTDGFSFTLLAGSFAARHAPTRLYSPLLGMDLACDQAASTCLALEPAFEYGILPLEGTVTLNGQRFAANELAYLGNGLSELQLSSDGPMRCILLGGEPFQEEILIWWNFVGHSKADIRQAQLDWESGQPRFGQVSGFAGPRLVAPKLPW